MCGRFTLTCYADDIVKIYHVDPVNGEWRPSYNIAPTQAGLIIKDDALKMARWGLIPSWSKDAKIGYRLINARAETVAEKPMYRTAFAKNRCLVLTDGFYEWKQTDDGKKPHFIHVTDRKVFSFAGLSSEWTSPDGKNVQTFSIITTSPNKLMKNIHDRMPVILPKVAEKKWLSEDTKIDELKALLTSYPAEKMEAYEVSTYVNSPRNNSSECVTRIKNT